MSKTIKELWERWKPCDTADCGGGGWAEGSEEELLCDFRKDILSLLKGLVPENIKVKIELGEHLPKTKQVENLLLKGHIEGFNKCRSEILKNIERMGK